jgi:hypothetical protein
MVLRVSGAVLLVMGSWLGGILQQGVAARPRPHVLPRCERMHRGDGNICFVDNKSFKTKSWCGSGCFALQDTADWTQSQVSLRGGGFNNKLQSLVDRILTEAPSPLERDRLHGFARSLAQFHDTSIGSDEPETSQSKRSTQTPTRSTIKQFGALLQEQRCDIPYPGLPTAQPFHNPDGFVWTPKILLEETISTILQEFDDFMKHQEEKKALASAPQSTTISDSWKTSRTQLCSDTTGFTKLCLMEDDGSITSVGEQYFSKTVSIVKSVIGHSLAPRPVHINCQHPQTGLAPHSDNINFLLTCHLGLSIPHGDDGSGCYFMMHDQGGTVMCKKEWKLGQLLVADTSFVHSTINNSFTEDRYVLSFNVWHPSLTPYERGCIKQLHGAMQSVSSQ